MEVITITDEEHETLRDAFEAFKDFFDKYNRNHIHSSVYKMSIMMDGNYERIGMADDGA